MPETVDHRLAEHSRLTPSLRTQRARLAAHAQHAAGKTNTEAAREAFQKRFLDEVDPDRVLPEAERLRRAEHARKRYYQALSYKAARARSQKTEANDFEDHDYSEAADGS